MGVLSPGLCRRALLLLLQHGADGGGRCSITARAISSGRESSAGSREKREKREVALFSEMEEGKIFFVFKVEERAQRKKKKIRGEKRRKKQKKNEITFSAGPPSTP